MQLFYCNVKKKKGFYFSKLQPWCHVPQDGLNYYSVYDISFNYVTGTTNPCMTDNTNLENTIQVTQLKWIDIYTSRTYVQKNYNLILLLQFRSSML